MGIKRKVLMDNDWVQLCKMTDDQPPRINGYVYSHEKRCNGNIVAALPHKVITENRNGEFVKVLSFLFRVEATPCWRGKTPVPSSFTGGIDYDMREYGPALTMAKELREEAGINSINANDLISLGTCFGTKSCDTVYHLYTIRLTNSQHDTLEVESELESTAYCKWVEIALQPVNDRTGTIVFLNDCWPDQYQFLTDPIASQIILRTLLHYSKK